jgi:hypothetical protein
METTFKTKLASSSSLMNTQKESSFLTNLFNDAEKNRFGIIPILIVINACIGGVAASFGAGDSAFKLGLVIFPTIIALALTLAVAPMRSILSLSALALVLDLMVLFI